MGHRRRQPSRHILHLAEPIRRTASPRRPATAGRNRPSPRVSRVAQPDRRMNINRAARDPQHRTPAPRSISRRGRPSGPASGKLPSVVLRASTGATCIIRCKKATDPFLRSQPSGNKKPPVRRKKANLRLLPEGAWSDPALRSPNPYRREKHGTQEDQRGQNQRGHPATG